MIRKSSSNIGYIYAPIGTQPRKGWWDFCDKCGKIRFFEFIEQTGKYSFKARCTVCGLEKEFQPYP